MEVLQSFFVIIDQSVIDQKQLRIPVELIQKFVDELSDIVKLSLPNGDEWVMHFKRAKKTASFHDGWESFMEDNSIGIKYFLLFKYRRNSCFTVHIFDQTATEFDYPCNARGRCESVEGSSGGGEDCGLGDDGTDLSVLGCSDDGFDPSILRPGLKRRRTTSAPGKTICRSYVTRSKVGKLKEESFAHFVDGNQPGNTSGGLGQDKANEECIGDLHAWLDGSGDRNDLSKQTEEIVEGKLMLQNPHFTVVMAKCHQLTQALYLTVDFARTLIPGNPTAIYLEDCDRKRWTVQCRFSDGRVRYMGKGWPCFSRDKELAIGDLCVFELIKDSRADKPVLKVHVLPSSGDLLDVA